MAKNPFQSTKAAALIVVQATNALGTAIMVAQDGGIELDSFVAMTQAMWKARERQMIDETLEGFDGE